MMDLGALGTPVRKEVRAGQVNFEDAPFPEIFWAAKIFGLIETDN